MMEFVGYLRDMEWEIVTKAPVTTAVAFLIIFFSVRWYYKKYGSTDSKIEIPKVQDNQIKLSIDKNVPSPKAVSTSQDLLDRWSIDWINLSSIINHDCLPAYYHTGLAGDYQPIESIEYEGGYHHDKTQKEMMLSFYFKESDINRLENILKHITTQPIAEPNGDTRWLIPASSPVG